MELSADNPADRVEKLIRLTERLTELLTRETTLFKGFKAGEAEALQAEKQQLANLYRREIGRIAQDKSLIAGAPAARREALSVATTAFNAALRENEIASHALRMMTEGLVHAVAEEVVRKRGATSNYGPGASQTTPRGAATSITLNQSV